MGESWDFMKKIKNHLPHLLQSLVDAFAVCFFSGLDLIIVDLSVYIFCPRNEPFCVTESTTLPQLGDDSCSEISGYKRTHLEAEPNLLFRLELQLIAHRWHTLMFITFRSVFEPSAGLIHERKFCTFTLRHTIPPSSSSASSSVAATTTNVLKIIITEQHNHQSAGARR